MGNSLFGKLILVVCCGLMFSCGKKNCFLQIYLGMPETEYNRLINSYASQGIVNRLDTLAINATHVDYEICPGIRGTLIPTFYGDTLEQFRLIITGIDNKDSIVNRLHAWINKNYAITRSEISDTRKYWLSDHFRVELAAVQPQLYDDAIIGISFNEVTIDDSYLIDDIYLKAETAFLWDIKTCDEAGHLAKEDFRNKRYRIVTYGLGNSAANTIRKRLPGYQLDTRLGGCISSDVGTCYSTRMLELLYSDSTKTLPSKNRKLLSIIENKGRSLAPTYYKAVCTEFIIKAVSKLEPLSDRTKNDIRIITSDDLVSLVRSDAPVIKGVATALIRSGQGVSVDNADNVLPGDLVQYWSVSDESAYGHCGVVADIKPGVSITLYSSHPVTNGFGKYTFTWPDKAYFVRLL